MNHNSGDLIEILTLRGAIDSEQARQIRNRAQRENIPLYQAVMDLNLIESSVIFQALSDASGLPLIDLSKETINPDVIKRVPTKVAVKYKFIPLKIEKNVLTAAFCGILSNRERDNLRLLLGMRIEPVLALPELVDEYLKNIYGLGADTVIQIRQDRAAQGKKTEDVAMEIYGETKHTEIEDENEASISNLVNQILREAVRMSCTDIHIEPFTKSVRLRYRIDGMLRTIPTPPTMVELHASIISRFKVMANLDITERRLPQDGRLRVGTKGQELYDLRVSLMPTRFGETICLRILSRSTIFLKMSELGLSSRNLSILYFLIDLPHGIVMVTGPTGSGKTTTLYAALASIRDRHTEKKIITVEDPIEYELEGITQMQMKAEIGLTFGAGLRSILRHDPDIILVGEIRDGETAEIAVRSAMTGHLVLSTIHTNDAVSAVNRMKDMGVEPYLLATSLCACLAQRLVRRICPYCKEKVEVLPARTITEIAKAVGCTPEEVTTYKGKGCLNCNKTGYKGRVAIYEVFLVDEDMQDRISAGQSTGELRRAAIERGMYTLRDDGWDKVMQGLTTVEEVERLTNNFQIGYDVAEWNEVIEG